MDQLLFKSKPRFEAVTTDLSVFYLSKPPSDNGDVIFLQSILLYVFPDKFQLKFDRCTYLNKVNNTRNVPQDDIVSGLMS